MAEETSALKEQVQTEQNVMERYAIVSIGEDSFAIPISNVTEVSVFPRYTKVPTLPKCILGVTNNRGNIISLIDSHHFFGIDQSPYTEETRVLFLSARGVQIGFVVDSIIRITEFSKNKINKPVGKEDDMITSLLRGVISMDKELIRILDVDKIMNTKYIRDYQ